MTTLNPKCSLCEDKGFYPIANGPEDFDMIECDCVREMADKLEQEY